ncbi:hypothetical protein BV898_14882 [Hypsibius exemplaris]|uniref:Uncharacterized protein n=1 Tax=Hypsibius exemplaris TaxID=2072580 RepID=A0A9X6NCZ5_HYPEX|nr:hypothetical protein BV898_14882 [Hypsibius exemplaris]
MNYAVPRQATASYGMLRPTIPVLNRVIIILIFIDILPHVDFIFFLVVLFLIRQILFSCVLFFGAADTSCCVSPERCVINAL